MDKQISFESSKSSMIISIAYSIREEVFLKEQKIPLERERDGLDSESMHYIISVDTKPIGCCRVRIIKEKKLKVERMAVLKEYRHKGYGYQLLENIIANSKGSAIEEVYLHAQLSTTEFYKKLGFKMRGEVFLDTGIDHIEMYISFK